MDIELGNLGDISFKQHSMIKGFLYIVQRISEWLIHSFPITFDSLIINFIFKPRDSIRIKLHSYIFNWVMSYDFGYEIFKIYI